MQLWFRCSGRESGGGGGGGGGRSPSKIIIFITHDYVYSTKENVIFFPDWARLLVYCIT